MTRVVAQAVDDRCLAGLLRIGVDEVSYRKGHRYLTVVASLEWAGRQAVDLTLGVAGVPSAFCVVGHDTILGADEGWMV